MQRTAFDAAKKAKCGAVGGRGVRRRRAHGASSLARRLFHAASRVGVGVQVSRTSVARERTTPALFRRTRRTDAERVCA